MFCVDVAFEIGECVPHFVNRRRNKSRLGKFMPRAADQVRPFAKLPGCLVLPTNSMHQSLVNFTHSRRNDGGSVCIR